MLVPVPDIGHVLILGREQHLVRIKMEELSFLGSAVAPGLVLEVLLEDVPEPRVESSRKREGHEYLYPEVEPKSRLELLSSCLRNRRSTI